MYIGATFSSHDLLFPRSAFVLSPLFLSLSTTVFSIPSLSFLSFSKIVAVDVSICIGVIDSFKTSISFFILAYRWENFLAANRHRPPEEDFAMRSEPSFVDIPEAAGVPVPVPVPVTGLAAFIGAGRFKWELYLLSSPGITMTAL